MLTNWSQTRTRENRLGRGQWPVDSAGHRSGGGLHPVWDRWPTPPAWGLPLKATTPVHTRYSRHASPSSFPSEVFSILCPAQPSSLSKAPLPLWGLTTPVGSGRWPWDPGAGCPAQCCSRPPAAGGAGPGSRAAHRRTRPRWPGLLAASHCAGPAPPAALHRGCTGAQGRWRMFGAAAETGF